MSTTLGAVKRGVRTYLDNLGASELVYGDPLIHKTVNAWLDMLASEGPIGQAWNTSWKAITAGTADYTVSTEHTDILAIKLASQGWLLTPRGPQELESFRQGTTVSSGDPTDYALVESTAQALQIRLFPTPDKSDTLHALVAVVPTTVDEDADTINLGKAMARALEWFVASDIAGDKAPKAWRANADRALQAERNRIHFLQAGSGFMPNML